MNNQQIYKFPFMTESHGGTYYSLETFRFFSVLTDGEINPEANYDEFPERLGLLFNNEMFYPITGEVYNEPITRYMSFFQFFNKTYSDNAIVPVSLDNGYGNLYILLSDHPIQHAMPKHHLSIEITNTVPANTDKKYWFGKKRPDAAYQRSAGYLGNYQRFISSMKNTGGTIVAALYPFSGNEILTALGVDPTNVNNNFAFQRFILLVQNTDPVVDATIYARFDFVK